MTTQEFLQRYLGELMQWGKFMLPFLLLELCFAAQRKQAWRRKLFNLHYLLYYGFIGRLVLPTLIYWVITHSAAVQPTWFGQFSPQTALGGVGYMLLYLFVYDFFYYWYHRAQHRWPWLWRVHRLHHSERALNVTTTLRHHWLEEPLKVFTVALPLAIVFAVPPHVTGFFAIVFASWTFLIHSNIRLQLGRLNWLIGNPQVHRIHHSDQPEHTDKNFAAFFPILDILFGTYFAPRSGEFPTTGLLGGGDYQNVWVASLSPWVDPTPVRSEHEQAPARTSTV